MTTDTSTEAVERLAEQCRQRSVQDCLIHTESWQRLCNEFGAAAALLRALSRERDEWKKRYESARDDLCKIHFEKQTP